MKTLIGLLLVIYVSVLLTGSLVGYYMNSDLRLSGNIAEATSIGVAKPGAIRLTNVDRIKVAAPPDFKKMTVVSAKKQAFFNYFTPIIDAENARIANQRTALEMLSRKITNNENLREEEQAFLNSLKSEYKISEKQSITVQMNQLMVRVDQIPRSLVLAQAANESAWGTSRFATKGNNYFGQWCFTKGCGLVPNQRSEGLTHEVRKFDSAVDSVAAYFRNINTHRSYRKLRAHRARFASEEFIQTESDTSTSPEPPTGYVLAQYLNQYSSEGEKYVRALRQLIRQNHLEVGTENTEKDPRNTSESSPNNNVKRLVKSE